MFKEAVSGVGGCIGLFLVASVASIALGWLGVAMGIFNLPLFKMQQKVQTNYGIIEKTYETEYCLANYEWFKSQKQGIDGMAEKIANAESELKTFNESAGARSTWTFEDKTESARLSSNVTGLKNRRVDMIKEYNARSEMLNRTACRELPLFISLD